MPAGEQRRHRGLRHQHAVDDERDRRRDQDVGGAAAAITWRRRPRDSRLEHRRDHHHRHRGGIGGPRARNAAQEHATRMATMRERAAPLARPRRRRSARCAAPRRRARTSCRPGRNRQRQQRVLGDAVIGIGRHRHDARPSIRMTAVPLMPSATASGAPMAIKQARRRERGDQASPSASHGVASRRAARRGSGVPGCAGRSAARAGAAEAVDPLRMPMPGEVVSYGSRRETGSRRTRP